MTAGIPGAGIGGLFYLVNALLMPVREAWLLTRGRSTPSSRRVVIQQLAMAMAILASMWATAWFLKIVISTQPMLIPFAAIVGVHHRSPEHISRLLTYSALAVGGITLGAVLASVHILRFIVHSHRSAKSVARSVYLTVVFCSALSSIVPLSVQAQARRDEQQYRALLRQSPDDSRATFQLAQAVEARDASEAERLYRRYVELEPDDPWGHIALAELLGNDRRYSEALKLYAHALSMAPEERDAAYGRDRMLGRSGRTDQAIAAYQR